MNRLRVSILCLAAIFMLGGCSTPKLPGPIKNVGVSPGVRGIFKSGDGGKTFESKAVIDDKNTLSQADILTIKIGPTDEKIVYIGTVDAGVYRSDNGGDSWKKIHEAKRCYGIEIDPRDAKTIYLSGIVDGRGKIFKSTDGGEKWTEIFTEPLGDSLISSLTLDSKSPDSLYAGDSRGFLIKTENAGVEWKRIAELGKPITSIALDSGDSRNVYLGVFQGGLYKIDFSQTVKNDKGITRIDSSNKMVDGVIVLDLRKQMKGWAATNNAFTLTADPRHSNTVFFGTGPGILKTEDGGNTWKELPTLEGPGNIVIKGLAVGGANSEIIYVATKGTFYKSVDSGKTWNVMEFNTPYTIEVLRVVPSNPEVVYLGIRNLNTK